MSTITKFQVPSEIILRSEIKNAPYNPRKISDKAAKALKKNIKDHGLMGGIVVNFNTMHLVSGHQRLAKLDELEGGQDYALRVERVELTEQEEKEQNIFMNNKNVMGEFDFDVLKDLLPGIDYKKAGLDETDLNLIGFDLADLEGSADDALNDLQDLTKEKDQLNESEKAERKEKVKEAKARTKEDALSRVNEGDTFFTVSFDTHEAKADFMERFGFSAFDKFIKGEVFENMIERIE